MNAHTNFDLSTDLSTGTKACRLPMKAARIFKNRDGEWSGQTFYPFDECPKPTEEGGRWMLRASTRKDRGRGSVATNWNVEQLTANGFTRFEVFGDFNYHKPSPIIVKRATEGSVTLTHMTDTLDVEAIAAMALAFYRAKTASGSDANPQHTQETST